MTITLGTNISSYLTRLQLDKVSDDLGDIYQKLSTGQKINTAGDDTAGLVISQNMQIKINASRQAMKNIQTAQSFLTTADDGMVSISEHFQRINDLLVNMANDTNNTDSRVAAVREIIERLAEIDRLAKSTDFNGMCMLDGSAESIIVQMGPDSDSTVSTIDISKALSCCTVESFSATLPEYLDPTERTVYKAPDGKWVYLGKDGSYYYDSGAKYEGDKDALEETIVVAKETGAGYIIKGTETDFTGNISKAGYKTFNPTNENCRAYLEKIQEAINTISTQRGLLGAYENRMESSYDSLSSRIQSLETAKVPYTDTDIAEGATELTKNQIMQQISVSILANTNTSQQLALSLLG